MLMRCPVCDAKVEPTEIAGEFFPCPRCTRRLFVDRAYGQTMFWVALATSTVGTLALGIRGWLWPFSVAICFIPALALVRLTLGRYYHPRLRIAEEMPGPYDHFSIHQTSDDSRSEQDDK